jgi:hypothetical protein
MWWQVVAHQDMTLISDDHARGIGVLLSDLSLYQIIIGERFHRLHVVGAPMARGRGPWEYHLNNAILLATTIDMNMTSHIR